MGEDRHGEGDQAEVGGAQLEAKEIKCRGFTVNINGNIAACVQLNTYVLPLKGFYFDHYAFLITFELT